MYIYIYIYIYSVCVCVLFKSSWGVDRMNQVGNKS